MEPPRALLEVHHLSTSFPTSSGDVRVVDGVSLTIDRREIVGVVGESGCGKTMLALSLLRLVPEPGRIVDGTVLFDGREVMQMNQRELRAMRGADLAMTFQDPMTSLNPLTRIGRQVAEAMTAHDRFTAPEANGRVLPLLDRVGLHGAPTRAAGYPHQLSGGMRQRVMVAIGVANEPALIIADEPTTALDVTTQAHIVRLLGHLNRQSGTAIMLITHNLALLAGLCDRLVVMYGGRVVEEGTVDNVFARPQHPYTWGLLQAAPRPRSPRRERLTAIDGAPPAPGAMPSGCTFHPRCRFLRERCRREEPPLADVGITRARCWVLMDSVRQEDRVDDERRQEREDANEQERAPGQGEGREDERAQGQGEGREQEGDHKQVQGRRPEPERVAPHGETLVPAQEGEDPPEILRLENVSKHFRAAGSREPLRAVDGVSLTLLRGETMALIGESGCGKSTLARIVTRLSEPTSGRVLFQGEDLCSMHGRRLRHVRSSIQIIFQSPFASLNPRMTAGDIVAEPLRNLSDLDSRQRGRRVHELLTMVGLDPTLAGRYPHEFSGGQRQRIDIARALAIKPSLIVCDEPISALDVSIQAQIINLLSDLQRDLGLTYLFIAHDLSVVRHLADRIAVMYLGSIVELADADDIFARPQHPYTRLLLDSVPIPDPRLARAALPPNVDDELPRGIAPPTGCRFHPRCPIAEVPGRCERVAPELDPHGAPGQRAACHFAQAPQSKP